MHRRSEAAHVLPLCHLPGYPRVGIPTVLWYSHEFTGLSDNRQPGDVGCRGKSSGNNRHPALVLERVRRGHVHCTPGPQSAGTP